MSQSLTKTFAASTTALALVLTMGSPSLAQDAVEDDEAYEDDQYIVVTGARIRQGGAQDIKHFRSVSLDGSFLPPASSLTLEGLLGEHDLTLPSQRECAQLFCVSAHSMAASFVDRPDDTIFVGLGFESGVDADVYRGEPVSLIAVVDRSGSMSDQPMTRVKQGLRSVLRQLRTGDRFGIVTYGSEPMVHLKVGEVDGRRSKIRDAIDGIEIEGSTNMEAGMKLGYAEAFYELENSKGKTRLMLFTDENPNVGNTSAEGFMGLATAGSIKGVGLTTIGVGTHFDGALAARLSSVRGGNLFFVDEAEDASSLFNKEFFNMIGEVAHDVAISIDPADGYKVTGVFGVPDNLMTEAPDGTVTVTIGSAFLSSNGGGIYASLGKSSDRAFMPTAPLGKASPAEISIAYVDALSGASERDSAQVAPAMEVAPSGLRTAHLLVDEYLGLDKALALYHEDGDRKGAYQALNVLSERLDASDLAGVKKERELVSGLRDRAAYIAGYSSEIPKAMRPLALVGEWTVVRHRGVEDVSRGDLISLTDRKEFITERMSSRDEGETIYQDFQINETRLYIEGTDLVLTYRIDGDKLRLFDRMDGTEIVLERADT